jgi:V8-like Glu-specific endopeptidase
MCPSLLRLRPERSITGRLAPSDEDTRHPGGRHQEITMTSGSPESLDAIIGQSRPQQSAPPPELSNPANLLVFGRDPQAAHNAAVDNAIQTDDQGRLRVTDPSVVFGIPLGRVEPVSVQELSRAAGVTDTDAEGEAYLPDWIGVSPAPVAAPQRSLTRLVRRNGSSVKPEWVIENDERVSYWPGNHPYSMVGRIFVWDNASSPNWAWWGTASLVGSRTVMTASHVVPWGSSNWKALFVPAYYDGASVHGSWAASWVTNAQGYSSHAQGDDMAVLRLDVPLGNSLGFFGFKTYNDDWEDQSVWTLPGYPWDRDNGQRPVVDLNFPIIDDDNDGAGVELEYRADTEGGQSGAPVYGWWSGAPYVVGTHSGGEDNSLEPRQNVAAGGSALSNLLQWARNNWP